MSGRVTTTVAEKVEVFTLEMAREEAERLRSLLLCVSHGDPFFDALFTSLPGPTTHRVEAYGNPINPGSIKLVAR